MRERAILTCFKRVIVCGFLLVIPMLTGQTILAASDTTFYVVRHAEQAQGPTDDPLTAQGMRRAEELCLVLEDVPLSAVYATQTLRTFQTALPAAAAAGVEITTYDPPPLTPFWALQLKREICRPVRSDRQPFGNDREDRSAPGGNHGPTHRQCL